MASESLFDPARHSRVEALVGALADSRPERPAAEARLEIGRPGRSLSLYPASDGYALQTELGFLTNRAIEPNVFFTGAFLAPAMPRLEERLVRLMVMRDEAEARSRLRFLMPFSIERPGIAVGPSILRVWAHSFGPLGTPLLDREDAAETLDNLLDALGQRSLGLPSVMMLPDLRLDGAFTRLLRAVAMSRNLAVAEVGRTTRAMLESRRDAPAYLARSLSRKALHEMQRQQRRLAERGSLVYAVARQPEEIARRLEEFIVLESGGWKGKQRTAIASDRYRAAFAREAVMNLAEADAVRIHTLDLDGRAVAAMIVFVISGEAFTWKTAYDESYSAYSPGKLLMMRLTEWHLDDPNIMRTDSCAVPDHPVMDRFWTERAAVGTLIVGLDPARDRDVRQAATQIHLYRNTRQIARLLRERVLSMARLRRGR